MTANDIKRLREKLGMTQCTLAIKLGVTMGAVCTWENGIRVPQSFSMRKLELLKQEMYRGKE